jgi:predicted nucleic acid-binding protein
VFLLDTNVVSELRRQKPHKAVLAWLAATDRRQLFVSAVTIGEIQAGIEIARGRDPVRAGEIETWLDLAEGSWHVLAMDGRSFRRWARLLYGKSNTYYEDATIAATALEHGLTVVTRNTRDFHAFGVPVFDPFRFGR